MGANDNKTRPPEEWRRAFEEQATNKAMAGVHTYAGKLARMIERATRRRDALIARELVLDAMSDTFAGIVKWDPAKASLASHLCRVIRSRTAHELDRAGTFVHLSLDDHDASVDALNHEASSALGVENESPERRRTAANARQVLDGIRKLAGGDKLVLQLLDAYDAGATERHEIVQLTGMKTTAYHNVRRRVHRLADKLPDDVRDAIVEITT